MLQHRQGVNFFSLLFLFLFIIIFFFLMMMMLLVYIPLPYYKRPSKNFNILLDAASKTRSCRQLFPVALFDRITLFLQ